MLYEVITDDFETLAQRHNGVWGGCWCIWFHQSPEIKRGTSEQNKALRITSYNVCYTKLLRSRSAPSNRISPAVGSISRAITSDLYLEDLLRNNFV